MDTKFSLETVKIGVVGLGYVGLPLACALAKKFKVSGFDINSKRVSELGKAVDRTEEIRDLDSLKNKNLFFTDKISDLSQCELLIVAVPTPIDNFKKPDLNPLISASQAIGKIIKKNCIVVYESTVYPGVTENICGKEIENTSGLKCGRDFFLGYSPERVNPGDHLHSIENVVKVVSGQTASVTDFLCEIYGAVIPAGIHRSPSMMVAEAAKVIENTQRDVNIALINELAQIFERIGLDTQDVLAAARTKWNFLDFRPGLVGGHCIGVDPYYLTHMSESLGYHADVISTARAINDSMAKFIAEKTTKLCLKNRRGQRDNQAISRGMKVALLGVTFKENVPDLRNTKVVDLLKQLHEFGFEVFCFDPMADPKDFMDEYGEKLWNWDDIPPCDAIVFCVKHKILIDEYPLGKIAEKLNDTRVLIDIKASLNRPAAEAIGIHYWRP